ncbi:unnamed protein product, partial [Rotaria sp. Silwood1]
MSSSSSSHLSTMPSSSRITSSNCHSASAPANSSQSSISIITRDSSNAANSLLCMQQYTTDRIKFLLKQQPSTYKVLENEKNKSSICWKVFGFPAKKIQNTNEYQKIDGFTSCQTCYQKFSYTSITGTRNMLSHSCVKNLSNTNITKFISSSSSSQVKPNDMMKIYEKVKLRSKFGEFDVNCTLRGADTISNHIYDLADDYRLKLKDILREPLESDAICVSPDLWSDDHKKISYLGITAMFTTSNYKYKTVDLCCKPFFGDDQTWGKYIN